MALEKTCDEPVQLSDPIFLRPTPVPGCDVCGALFRQWQAVGRKQSSGYDPSKASDLLVEIGRHPHEGAK